MILTFTYTNHRDETSRRRVQPATYWYGKSPFHDGVHAYLRCWDLDRQDTRSFMLCRMSDIGEEPDPPVNTYTSMLPEQTEVPS